MAVPTTAHPELARALAAALGFRLEDLEANRAGRLARRQRLALLLIYLAVIGLTLLFPVGFLSWLLATPGPPRTEPWIVLLCAALPLFLLGSMALWIARALLRDALAGAVVQQVGPARTAAITRTLRGRSDTRYTVQFGSDHSFNIPQAAFDAFQPGRVYRAYYLPASGKLVSVEPIG